MRELNFIFQEPGMIEAIASDPVAENNPGHPTGYADSVVPDLLVDRDDDSRQPYAWMCYNFERTYPLVIWGLKLFMDNEKFDVPQADLQNVPLHVAFSWAYHHFVLQNNVQSPKPPVNGIAESYDYTRAVLTHALATA
jgi:hypothetical protein